MAKFHGVIGYAIQTGNAPGVGAIQLLKDLFWRHMSVIGNVGVPRTLIVIWVDDNSRFDYCGPFALNN